MTTDTIRLALAFTSARGVTHIATEHRQGHPERVSSLCGAIDAPAGDAYTGEVGDDPMPPLGVCARCWSLYLRDPDSCSWEAPL